MALYANASAFDSMVHPFNQFAWPVDLSMTTSTPGSAKSERDLEFLHAILPLLCVLATTAFALVHVLFGSVYNAAYALSFGVVELVFDLVLGELKLLYDTIVFLIHLGFKTLRVLLRLTTYLLWYSYLVAGILSLGLVLLAVGLAYSDDYDALVAVVFTGVGVFSPTETIPEGLVFIKNDTRMARFSELFGDMLLERLLRSYTPREVAVIIQEPCTQIFLAICGASANLFMSFIDPYSSEIVQFQNLWREYSSSIVFTAIAILSSLLLSYLNYKFVTMMGAYAPLYAYASVDVAHDNLSCKGSADEDVNENGSALVLWANAAAPRNLGNDLELVVYKPLACLDYDEEIPYVPENEASQAEVVKVWMFRIEGDGVTVEAIEDVLPPPPDVRAIKCRRHGVSDRKILQSLSSIRERSTFTMAEFFALDTFCQLPAHITRIIIATQRDSEVGGCKALIKLGPEVPCSSPQDVVGSAFIEELDDSEPSDAIAADILPPKATMFAVRRRFHGPPRPPTVQPTLPIRSQSTFTLAEFFALSTYSRLPAHISRIVIAAQSCSEFGGCPPNAMIKYGSEPCLVSREVAGTAFIEELEDSESSAADVLPSQTGVLVVRRRLHGPPRPPTLQPTLPIRGQSTFFLADFFARVVLAEMPAHMTRIVFAAQELGGCRSPQALVLFVPEAPSPLDSAFIEELDDSESCDVNPTSGEEVLPLQANVVAVRRRFRGPPRPPTLQLTLPIRSQSTFTLADFFARAMLTGLPAHMTRIVLTTQEFGGCRPKSLIEFDSESPRSSSMNAVNTASIEEVDDPKSCDSDLTSSANTSGATTDANDSSSGESSVVTDDTSITNNEPEAEPKPSFVCPSGGSSGDDESTLFSFHEAPPPEPEPEPEFTTYKGNPRRRGTGRGYNNVGQRGKAIEEGNAEDEAEDVAAEAVVQASGEEAQSTPQTTTTTTTPPPSEHDEEDEEAKVKDDLYSKMNKILREAGYNDAEAETNDDIRKLCTSTSADTQLVVLKWMLGFLQQLGLFEEASRLEREFEAMREDEARPYTPPPGHDKHDEDDEEAEVADDLLSKTNKILRKEGWTEVKMPDDVRKCWISTSADKQLRCVLPVLRDRKLIMEAQMMESDMEYIHTSSSKSRPSRSSSPPPTDYEDDDFSSC